MLGGGVVVRSGERCAVSVGRFAPAVCAESVGCHKAARLSGLRSLNERTLAVTPGFPSHLTLNKHCDISPARDSPPPAAIVDGLGVRRPLAYRLVVDRRLSRPHHRQTVRPSGRRSIGPRGLRLSSAVRSSTPASVGPRGCAAASSRLLGHRSVDGSAIRPQGGQRLGGRSSPLRPTEYPTDF